MSAEDLTRRLKQLHELRATASVRRPREAFTSEAMQSLAILDQMQERLAGCLQSLNEMAPALRPVRRMDSGAWRLGLSQPLDAEQRRGRASRPFSRCEFTVEIDMERRQVRLECHATVFDRDLPTLRRALPVDELPWTEVQDFLEAACLQFAERWFVQVGRRGEPRLAGAEQN